MSSSADVIPGGPRPELAHLPTPFLVVDHDVLSANLTRQHRRLADAGLALRPHVKTHKVLEIADLQVAAGESGFTVATPAEAEVFADAGYADLFIAYPLWVDADRARRLRDLSDRVVSSSVSRVVVDTAAGGAQPRVRRSEPRRPARGSRWRRASADDLDRSRPGRQPVTISTDARSRRD